MRKLKGEKADKSAIDAAVKVSPVMLQTHIVSVLSAALIHTSWFVVVVVVADTQYQ